MEWYYSVEGERKGPVSDEEFQRLAQQGVVTPQTLVWRAGMATWQPYAPETPIQTSLPPAEGRVTCSGCGNSFAPGDVIPVANGLYCVACKPVALQRIREGVPASAVDGIRNKHLKHEASVKSVGLLYLLGGTALFLIGIGTGVAYLARSELWAAIPGFLLVGMGVGQFWVGLGLRRLKPWTRIPTGILSGIGLIGFPIGTLINGYILYLIFCKKGKMVFSDEYRDVIEQTPHIKYRTSIIVWIFLGLLILLVAVGLIGVLVGRR